MVNGHNIELGQLKWKFRINAVTETWTTEDDQNALFRNRMILKSWTQNSWSF